MKGLIVLSVLSAVVLCVLATSVQLHSSPSDELDGSNSEIQTESEHIEHPHGSRMKRSPVDPIVAPLLIGKSFLYGALLGPKLFHRPHYYRPYYYGHGHGYGHGYGYGRGWGWGWGGK